MSFTVAIVGRPNVGKSTLFNRFLEERKAIVDDISGVTRDRQYGVTEWNGKNFNVIDTGGFVPDSSDMFETEIRKQVRIAIDEANCIIFMVDAAVGMTDLDASMADMLRRTTKPVLVVANKVDNSNRALDATEFYSMGFEHNYFVSLEVFLDVSGHLHTFYSGGANSDLPGVFYKENLVESHLRTFFGLKTVHEDLLIFLYFVLMPCYFYDSVHGIDF